MILVRICAMCGKEPMVIIDVRKWYKYMPALNDVTLCDIHFKQFTEQDLVACSRPYIPVDETSSQVKCSCGANVVPGTSACFICSPQYPNQPCRSFFKAKDRR